MPKKHDQDATSNDKLLRLLRMIMFAHHKLYLQDLADRLECSPQTVARLMGNIEKEFGERIHSGTDHRRKWYSYVADNRHSLGLDTAELHYLSVCKDLAAPYLSDDVAERLDKIIMDVSINSLGKGADDNKVYSQIIHPDYNFYSKGRIDYEPYVDTISRIEQAVRELQAVKLKYASANSNAVKDIIMVPMSFAVLGGAIYALGEQLKDDFSKDHVISLAVHRIQGVEDTGRIFKESDLPFISYRDFGLPWQETPSEFCIVIKAGTAANYVRERTWAGGQKLEDLPNGDVRLTFKSRSLREIITWCRGFGDKLVSVSVDGREVKHIMSNDTEGLW